VRSGEGRDVNAPPSPSPPPAIAVRRWRTLESAQSAESKYSPLPFEEQPDCVRHCACCRALRVRARRGAEPAERIARRLGAYAVTARGGGAHLRVRTQLLFGRQATVFCSQFSLLFLLHRQLAACQRARREAHGRRTGGTSGLLIRASTRVLMQQLRVVVNRRSRSRCFGYRVRGRLSDAPYLASGYNGERDTRAYSKYESTEVRERSSHARMHAHTVSSLPVSGLHLRVLCWLRVSLLSFDMCCLPATNLR